MDCRRGFLRLPLLWFFSRWQDALNTLFAPLCLLSEHLKALHSRNRLGLRTSPAGGQGTSIWLLLSGESPAAQNNSVGSSWKDQGPGYCRRSILANECSVRLVSVVAVRQEDAGASVNGGVRTWIYVVEFVGVVVSPRLCTRAMPGRVPCPGASRV